jgi:hypothetical protein
MYSNGSYQLAFGKRKKTPNNCHMYYVPNLHHFHAFFMQKQYESFYPCRTCGIWLLSMTFQVWDASMYGYGRAYRSMMDLGQLFTLKNCRKLNNEDKNTNKFTFFKKTIFPQEK